MSDLIRLLPDHIANQIAAGEVVQRPASVVKELVENCIDAGATKVEVNIKDAGRTLIQVVDNGQGMSMMDARMAFERHATSKIQHAEDLFALTTKGFRGEALASIAAVAQVALKTKRAADELGTLLQIEGSQLVKQEPITCAIGASFEVKNLFFNIPARRNFLKSDSIEFKHILDDFERIALAHPEITFKLIHNEQEIHHLIAGPLRKRIVDVFGKSYNDKLVPISEKTDIVTIEGFVGKPEAARKSRGEQFFFVNNRFFRDNYFNHAVGSAFEQLLPSKVFPSYFLFLTVDPKHIDVNVHPTKTEIKFEEDKAIYSILKSTIRSGLGRFNIMPTLDFERETSFDLPASMLGQPAVQPQIQVDPTYNPFISTASSTANNSGYKPAKAFSSAVQQTGFGSATPLDFDQFWKEQQENVSENEAIEQQVLGYETSLPQGPYIQRGHLLIGSVPEGLLMIHIRRAYERIVYEQSLKQFYTQPLGSQQLLFPLTKHFSNQEQMVWEEYTTTLKRIGFAWTWKDDEIEISGMPDLLSESTVLACIDLLLEQFQMGHADKGDSAHIVIQQLAFAASTSKKLSFNEGSAKELIEQLFELEEHSYAPNGKRIISLLSNEQLLHPF